MRPKGDVKMMDSLLDDRRTLGLFKRINVIVICFGILLTSYLGYSIYQFERLNEETYYTVLEIEKGSAIILQMQKYVNQMEDTDDGDLLIAYHASFEVQEARLLAYFDMVKKNTSFVDEADRLINMYKTWRNYFYMADGQHMFMGDPAIRFQKLEEINTKISDLKGLQYKLANVQGDELVMKIRIESYLLMAIALVMSGSIVFSFKNIEKSNSSKVQAIKESQLLYVNVSNTMPDAMLLIDDHTGEILDANQASETLYGYSIETMLTKRNVDLSAEPELTVQSAKSRVMDIPIRWHKDQAGRVFPVEIKASRFEWKGRAVHLAWIHDISLRLQSEKELKEALESALAGEHAKASFLANISHEIRTPLNGLSGALQLIAVEQNCKGSENLIQMSLESTNRLIKIFDQVLEYSNLEAGIFEFKQSAYDLVQVIEDVITLLLPYAFTKSVKVMQQLDDIQVLKAVGDPLRIKQILIHLISNAIKFTDAGGQVIVHPSHDSDLEYLTFSVQDTGCGIKEADFDRIFRSFEQGDDGLTKRFEGVGLGLPITRSMVAYMNGQMTFESVYGEGSCFTVKLPMDSTKSIGLNDPIQG